MNIKKGLVKILFSIVITIIIFISMQYLELKKDEVVTNSNIKTLLNQKEKTVRDILEILYKEAKEKGELQRDKIVNEIQNSYKDKDELKLDLIKLNNGNLDYTKLLYILEKNTKGVYFNVVNDNNDPFIAMKKVMPDETIKVIIVSDFSENCQAYGRVRIEDDEIKMHFNPELARYALHNMVLKGVERGFWSFLKVYDYYSWYNDIRNLKNNDLDLVFSIFKKYNYNINVFKSLEFLTVIPIEKYQDVSGTPSKIAGIYNKESSQMFYFYNFNLLDQINANSFYSEKIEHIDTNIDKEVEQIKIKRQQIYFTIIIESFVLILFALLLTSIQYKE